MYKIDYSNGNYIVIDRLGYEATRHHSLDVIKGYLDSIGISFDDNCEISEEAEKAMGRK